MSTGTSETNEPHSLSPAGNSVTKVAEGALVGQRLDAALASIIDLGLRGRRRLCEDGRVYVNSKKARPGLLLRAGDSITVLHEQPANTREGALCRLLLADADYAFFLKPAGLHTMSLDGRNNDTLERQARSLLPDSELIFLQRLDRETSGIVGAARNAAAARAFRQAEKRGEVSKRYVCVLEGALYDERLVQKRLVSSGGRAMRAMSADDDDPARWTRFIPLDVFTNQALHDGPLTLCGTVIQRGMRHQIRCHAASAGFPLAGDVLYGGVRIPNGTMLLHHGCLSFSGRSVVSLPLWPNLCAAHEAALKSWFTATGNTC